jgi:hypothetical protein
VTRRLRETPGHEQRAEQRQAGRGTDRHPVGHDHAIEEGLQEQARTTPRVTQTRRRPAAVARDDVGNNSTPNVLRVTCAPRAIR